MAKQAPKPAAAAAPAPAANPANPLFSKRLRMLKENWANSKEESKKAGGSFEITLEDGKYKGRLTRAEIKDTGEKMGVVFDFTMFWPSEAEGEMAGRWDGLETAENMIWLQRDLRNMGIDVDAADIDDLPAILTELVEAAPCCDLQIKTNKGRDREYKNLYINGQCDPPDAEATEVAAEGEEPAAEEPATEEEPAAEEPAEEPVEGEEPAAEEEPAEEEPAEEEGPPEPETGSRVSYISPDTKRKSTGTVSKYDKAKNTVSVLNDKSKKTHAVNIATAQVEVLAEVG